MADPLFPIHAPAPAAGGSILIVEPYRHDDAWVFDDDKVGLVREPFVAGVSEMIDRLVADMPSAGSGFKLLFADWPFAGHQAALRWARADTVEGHWYQDETSGAEGWLCPALFFYFQVPPPRIFVRAEPK